MLWFVGVCICFMNLDVTVHFFGNYIRSLSFVTTDDSIIVSQQQNPELH